jgi:hypothetical protein
VYGWINSVVITTNDWNELDVEPDIIELTSSIKSTEDLSKIQTTYSNEFELVLNKQNMDALEFHPDYLHNFNNRRTIYDMRLNLSDIHFQGNLEITEIYYENGLATATVNLFSKLAEFVNKLESKLISEISSSYMTYNLNDMDNHIYTTNYHNKEYCYILHDFGQNINKQFLSSSNYKSINKQFTEIDYNYGSNSGMEDSNSLSYEQMGLGTDRKGLFINNFIPTPFVANIFKKIHSENGYILRGDFIESDDFQKLLILPNNFINKNKTRNEFKLITPTNTQKFYHLGSNQVHSLILKGDIEPEYDNGCVVYPNTDYVSRDGIYTGFEYDIDVTAVRESGFTDNSDCRIVFEIGYKYIGNTDDYFVRIEKGFSITNSDTKEINFKGKIDDVYIPYGAGLYNNVQFKMTFYTTTSHRIDYEVADLNINNVGLIRDKIAPTYSFNIADILPEMNQLDFIKTIVQMFNLYVEFDEKVITYKTRDEYFSNGNIENLSTVNINSTNLILPSKYVKKFYKWHYNQPDNGEIKRYNETHFSNYGDLDLSIGHNFDEEQTFETPVSIVYHHQFDNFEIGRTCSNDVENDRRIFSGINEDNYYNDWDMPSEITFGVFAYENNPVDENNEVLKVVDEKFSVAPNPCSGYPLTDCYVLSIANKCLSNEIHYSNLYNNYWKSEIENITNPTSNKIEIKTYLSNKEYAKMNLNNTIRFENGYYYIETISDWNSNSLTKITLLKRISNPFY